MEPSLIEINNLTVTVGDRQILSDVSMRLAQGQLLSVLGPNGSGKSTLLRILAGLDLESPLKITAGGVRMASTAAVETLTRGGRPGVAWIGSIPDPAFPLSVEDLVGLGRIGHRGGSRAGSPGNRFSPRSRRCLAPRFANFLHIERWRETTCRPRAGPGSTGQNTSARRGICGPRHPVPGGSRAPLETPCSR